MSEQRTGLPGVPTPTEMNDPAAPGFAPMPAAMPNPTPTMTQAPVAGTTYRDPAAGALASDAPGQGQGTATQVLDRASDGASDVLSHVGEGAGDVKDAVANHVQNVASEAKREAKHLVEEARVRVAAEADSSTKQVAQVLVDAGQQLLSMADRGGEDGPATDLVREIGGRAQQLGERIQREGYRGVTEDLTRWARRNPGIFLLAAGTTGFVVGRLVRNVNTSKITDAAKNGSNGANGADTFSGPTANQLFDPATGAPGFTPSVVDLTESGYAEPAFAEPTFTEPAFTEPGFGGIGSDQGTVPGMRP